MVHNYDEQSYQDELDARFYKGRKPSESAPFTVQDIAFLIARLSSGPFENKLPIIRSYYLVDCVGARVCKKYRIRRKRLARLLKKVRKEYDWLMHRSRGGFMSFSLKDIIALVSQITLTLTPLELRWIQAYYDVDGAWRKTCLKCHISKTGFFRFLHDKIKVPYLNFCFRPAA